MEPKFLNEELVKRLHTEVVSRTGGSAGIRDNGLLLSALEMPRASFGGQYLHEDLYMMAAAYLYHLVQNHPFVDGNKRIGVAAAMVFLHANGIQVVADEDELADFVLEVAQGMKRKPEIAEFLRQHSHQR